MKNKTLKEILVPAVMLFVIAAVCTALLAGTNLLTKDKIAEIVKNHPLCQKCRIEKIA